MPKKAWFDGKDDRHAANLKDKEAIIKKLNDFKAGKDQEADLAKIGEITAGWSAIGHVPADKVKAVKKAYDEAQAKAFAALKIDPDKKDDVLFEFRLSQISKSDRAEALFDEERKRVRDRMSKMESDILQYENNLGFFANSKGTESMRAEVEQKIAKAKEEVLLQRAKLSKITAAVKAMKAAATPAPETEGAAEEVVAEEQKEA